MVAEGAIGIGDEVVTAESVLRPRASSSRKVPTAHHGTAVAVANEGRGALCTKMTIKMAKVQTA